MYLRVKDLEAFFRFKEDCIPWDIKKEDLMRETAAFYGIDTTVSWTKIIQPVSEHINKLLHKCTVRCSAVRYYNKLLVNIAQKERQTLEVGVC